MPKRNRLFRLSTLVLLASPSAFANVIFSDATFLPANYLLTPIFAGGTTSVGVSQCATCGNPGNALLIHMQFPVDGGDGDVGVWNNSFAYNPLAQGAITSIGASVDKNIILNFTSSPPFGNTFHPMIVQDGMYYLASIDGPSFSTYSSGFNTIAQSGLVASDFQQFDFATESFVAGNPNFAGDAMVFGLAQLTGVDTPGFAPDFQAIYDNLNIEIQATPEPSTMIPLAAMLCGIAAAIRRRR